ncbi:MAG: hypothetical protein A4E28_03062 [Methanocella sp. PtaU1.Bin125]|nr:MAG: hypothetical protein A4E28_03062 [Methanocella sp. PtaU1.Bin125]
MIIAAGALSGCTTPAPTSGTGTPTASTPGTTKTPTGANAKASVTQSGDTITITGTKTDDDNDQLSEQFTLTQGTYIYTFSNTGSALGNTFIASVDSPDGDLYEAVSLGDSSGMGYIAVDPDGFWAKPGPAVLSVGYGGTYTMTISKPTTGDAPPVTLTGQPRETAVKAVNLNAGPVTINVRHNGYSSDQQGTTMVSLHKVDNAKSVSLDGAWIMDETGQATGTVAEPGLYVFSVSFRAHTTGEATLTQ